MDPNTEMAPRYKSNMSQFSDGPGITFLGSRQLLEYYLVSETLTNYSLNSVSFVKVEFEFANLYRFYIGNIFLPSLLFVVICYATLFFDLEDFQDRITVSLTSLLVLSTFFNQVSHTIPRTSYLKLIDVWFLALILQEFFIILSLVYVENLRLAAGGVSATRVLPAGFFFRRDALAKRAFGMPEAVRANKHMRSLAFHTENPHFVAILKLL
ncbi:probable ligand-gated ion channel 46 [Penaeus monodon]|uniref:probable ligand-gated ion channel 46 n=1 Tax=Penaeus monodon TaxID=6687 RepID=UPI0018A6E443|nr:probable ligand-gated ion channel 46 [Penaeus monodon]